MDWQHHEIRQVPDPNSLNQQQVSRGQEVPSAPPIPGSHEIRQVPDPNSLNQQQVLRGQEVPSPQQIPGSEVFLERPDVPAKPPLPATQPDSTEWIHTRQGFIQRRKNVLHRILSRFFRST